MVETIMPRNGTTLRELDTILIAPLVSLPLYSCVCYFLSLCLAGRSIRTYRARVSIEFLLEFVVLVVPLLFMYTVAADHVTAMFAIGGSLGAALLLCVLRRKRRPLSVVLAAIRQPYSPGLGREFLTHYRSYIYVSTVICILAIDFVVFPRRFFKTKVYGKGLMDVGVGCYVISGGMVSRSGRHGNVAMRSKTACAQEIASSVKTATLLMLIGAGRYAVTAVTKYHTTNVTEYGVHWNFFVTLSVVRLAAGILLLVRRWIRPWIWFLVLSVVHQTLLSSQLTAFVDQKGARDGTGFVGFMTANREGVVSCLGHLAIHMAGVSIGQMLAAAGCLEDSGRSFTVSCSSSKVAANGYAVVSGTNDEPPSEAASVRFTGSGLQLLFRLLLWSAIALVSLVVCEHYIEPVSRRTANVGYILWMIHLNLLLMSANLVAAVIRNARVVEQPGASRETDSDAVERAEPCTPLAAGAVPLLAAINQNGLLVFLFANILTGLINNYTKTRDYGQPAAMSILVAYSLANCLLARLLHWRRIRIF